MAKIGCLFIICVIFGAVLSYGITAGLLYLGSFAFPYEWSWQLSLGVWAILMLLSLFFKSNNTVKINKD